MEMDFPSVHPLENDRGEYSKHAVTTLSSSSLGTIIDSSHPGQTVFTELAPTDGFLPSCPISLVGVQEQAPFPFRSPRLIYIAESAVQYSDRRLIM